MLDLCHGKIQGSELEGRKLGQMSGMIQEKDNGLQ